MMMVTATVWDCCRPAVADLPSGPTFWYPQVLLAGLSAAQSGSSAIRELAFLLVLALAQHHSRLFEPVLDVVLQPLLQGCGDESREVREGLVMWDVCVCTRVHMLLADSCTHRLICSPP